MTVIRIERDKAERMIAQILRDERKMLPEKANGLASYICKRLQLAMGTPRKPGFSGYRPDPEGDALKDTITKLSRDARRELMALMWLGRGDVAGSFADHLKQAYKHPDEGIDYIAGKSPALPKYFRAGLEKVRREGRP
jgi:hypothetical protein